MEMEMKMIDVAFFIDCRDQIPILGLNRTIRITNTMTSATVVFSDQVIGTRLFQS